MRRTSCVCLCRWLSGLAKQIDYRVTALQRASDYSCFFTCASFQLMKITHVLTLIGVLALGLALGSFGTHYFKPIAVSAHNQNTNYRSNTVTTQVQVTQNSNSASDSTSANEMSTHGSEQMRANSADLSDYRHLLQLLLDIDNADSQALYSIADQRLLNASVLAPENRVVTTALFQRWAQIDVATAFTWIEDELLPVLANSANHPQLDDAVTALSKLQPEQTTLWIDQLSNEQSHAVRALLLEEFIVADTDINQAISSADESEKPWLSARFAAELAETDPLKAYEWTIALADETSRDAAMSELLWRWAESDVQGLSEHISRETDPELQRHMYNKVGDQIIGHSIQTTPNSV